MKCIVTDLDGTIADLTHRIYLLKPHGDDVPQWDAFNEQSAFDPIIRSTVELLRLLNESNWKILISTARPDKYRGLTRRWLQEKKVPYDQLYMRRAGDFRSDVEIKKDHYFKWIKGFQPIFALDDRDSTVAMWRELGVPCFQIQKGAY